MHFSTSKSRFNDTLSFLAAERHAYFRTFILCNVAGIFGLFPLIFTPGGKHHRIERRYRLTLHQNPSLKCCILCCGSFSSMCHSIVRFMSEYYWHFCRTGKSQCPICMSILNGSIAFVVSWIAPILTHPALSPTLRMANEICHRYPRSPIFVIIDIAEKIYLAGFPFLLVFVAFFPVCMNRRLGAEVEAKEVGSTMEFLPLMVTSVYCAVGIVWGYLRLLFTYLNEEKTYQGQLSTIR